MPAAAVGDEGGWSHSPFFVGVPAEGQPGPPSDDQGAGPAPPSEVWVLLQDELPPMLLCPQPPMLPPACAVCICTQCCSEGVGGRRDVRIWEGRRMRKGRVQHTKVKECAWLLLVCVLHTPRQAICCSPLLYQPANKQLPLLQSTATPQKGRHTHPLLCSPWVNTRHVCCPAANDVQRLAPMAQAGQCSRSPGRTAAVAASPTTPAAGAATNTARAAWHVCKELLIHNKLRACEDRG